MSTPGFTIRPCRPDDAETLVALIHELAVYEKLEQFARATPEALRRHLFGERPYAEAILAERDGEPLGFALFFHNYSTFRAQPGIYLEDLFVKPAERGRGVGKALLARLAALAIERGCGRLEWAVLDWNTPSIAFYRSLGALPLDQWTMFRLDDQALSNLAEQDRSEGSAES